MLKLDHDREILGYFLWLGPAADTTDHEKVFVSVYSCILSVCLSRGL